MQKYVLALAVCGLVAGSASEAAAQGAERRGYITLSGGFQSTSGDLDETVSRERYGETETINVDGSFDSGALIDFSAGYFVTERVSLGIGLHRMSSSSDGGISGTVPHPIFFSRPRAFESGVENLSRSELGVHLSVGYTLPLAERLDVMLFAGPSSFRLSQEVVSDVTIGSEAAPFDTVTATAVVAERTKTVWGGHIGADISYMVLDSPNASVGAGLFLRYAGASADVDLIGSQVSTDVGGFQVGAGLRLKF